MGKNVQQRRGMVSLGILCTLFWGIGVGYDIGHAQTNQGGLTLSMNKGVASSVDALHMPGNLDKKHLAMTTRIEKDNGCLEPQNPTQFDQSVKQAQSGNHTHRVFQVRSIEEVDEVRTNSFMKNPADLQEVINAQWSGMMTALAKGDVEKALHYIATSQREVVWNDWTTLHDSFDGLAQAFAGPLDVTDMQETQVTAQAAMPPTKVFLQCPLEVKFILDTDGQWRVSYY